jgi:hypothetical protein
LRFFEESSDRRRIQQINLTARHPNQRGKSLPLQLTPDGTADKPSMASDIDFGILIHASTVRDFQRRVKAGVVQTRSSP